MQSARVDARKEVVRHCHGVNFEYDWETEQWTLPLDLFRNQVLTVGSWTPSLGGRLKPSCGIRVDASLPHPI